MTAVAHLVLITAIGLLGVHGMVIQADGSLVPAATSTAVPRTHAALTTTSSVQCMWSREQFSSIIVTRMVIASTQRSCLAAA